MNAPSELASRFPAPLQTAKKLGISGHLALPMELQGDGSLCTQLSLRNVVINEVGS